MRLCFFPALEYLKVRFVVQWYNLEVWLAKDMHSGAREICGRIQSFSELCATAFDKVKVDISLYIRAELFECSPSINWPRLSAKHWGELRGRLMFLEENYLLCRASLGSSDDSTLYHGMELDLEDYGHMDRHTLEAIVDDVRQVSTYRSRLRTLTPS